MGIFFEDSPLKDIKKPKLFVAIQTILLIGSIFFIIMGFINTFFYFGVSWLLISISFGMDAVFYYKIEGKWDKSSTITTIIFLITAIVFLMGD